MVLGKEQGLGGVNKLNGRGKGGAVEGQLVQVESGVGLERLLRVVYREEIDNTIESGGGGGGGCGEF